MEKTLPKVSKTFLEDILKRKIESFTILPEPIPSDNLWSAMYRFEITLANGETLHLISKSFPSDPIRQSIAVRSNFFWNELTVYKTVIPTLNGMVLERGFRELLNVPHFVGGKSLNYNKLDKGDPALKKLYDPFDNFILMTDHYATDGFELKDRPHSLNIDQMEFVIKSQAKVHAYSWIYRQIHELESMNERFHCLGAEVSEEDMPMYTKLVNTSIEHCANALQDKLGPDSHLAIRTRGFTAFTNLIFSIALPSPVPCVDGFAKAHRVMPKPGNCETMPWKVLIHADSFIHNFLFRYDAKTGKPTDFIATDYKGMYEHCPTIDLAFFIYTSTTTEFRKNHLDQILQLYIEEFTRHCNNFNAELLSNFTLSELKRRFHLSKVYGLLIASCVFPLLYKSDNPTLASLFYERLFALTTELYEEGVL